MIEKMRNRTFLGAILFLICIVIFIVGLWPFNFRPANRVAWLPNRNGIQFYGRGMLFSKGPSGPAQGLDLTGPLTIEMLLTPVTGPTHVNPHILSFYNDQNEEISFIAQRKSVLLIQKQEKIETRLRDRAIAFQNALPAGKELFITVTSNDEGTSLYEDGNFAKIFRHFTLLPKINSERLNILIGNSPTGKHPWEGILLGLAIYNRALTPQEVLQDYKEWIHAGSLSVSGEEKPVALYLFDEEGGNIVHSHTGRGLSLQIPEIFRPLRRTVLAPPTSNFHIQDITINILGFIPLGFFFTLYLSKETKRSLNFDAFLVSLIGGLMSLIIELLQAYLPSRISSLMDLLCNIAGTAAGAIICILAVRSQKIVAKHWRKVTPE
jgi:VanZ family protein